MPVKKSFLFLILILFWIRLDLLPAQNGPAVTAIYVENPVIINGILDDEAWQKAEPATGFLQFEPDEGAPASQRTEVRVLYGNGNIYIGAMLYDENPSGIQQSLGRRDEYNQADWFLVSIDSYYNRRNAFTFGVNAAGVQLDALLSGDAGGGPPGGGGGGGSTMPPGMDSSWNAIWESAVSVHDQGWTVEMRIPLSMLRFPDSEVQTWGIHFTRRIPGFGEVSEWPLVPRAQRSNLVAQFGQLTGIRNIEPRPNIQVRPYTVSGLNTMENLQNPGEAQVNTNFDMGGDLKIGLGSNITLDVTINPDFGQVESDPAVLNLTAFETFFAESRPFFTEGVRIYEFPLAQGGGLLYTRRIGAEAPIIGAAKLSGRTEKGTSFGLLAATSGNNFDPSQSYGAARIRQQFGEFSEAGLILTGYEAPVRNGAGRIQSMTGGVDWDIRFLDNRYSVDAYSIFTHRSWTAPEQKSTTGFGGRVWLTKREGILTGSLGITAFDDQFNPNDIGRLARNNFIANRLMLQYQLNEGRPFGYVRRADLNLSGVQRLIYHNGLDEGFELALGTNITLMRFQRIRLTMIADRLFGGYDIFETRGLGPWARPGTLQIQTEFSTDQRRQWQLSPEMSYTWHEDNGQGYMLGLRGNWNIGTRLSLSGNMRGRWEEGVSAWVSNESFLNAGQNWAIGRRSVSPDRLSQDEYRTFDDEGQLAGILSDVSPYTSNAWYVPVFGRRNTRSLDFTLRSDVTFTTKLSLQLYSQLFLARGLYDEFNIMQTRDDLADFPSYPKRSEFNLSSLQSNVVVRWEYRSGSNIYLVWTHGRRMRESLNPLAPYGPSPYQRSIGGQINDTFDIFPENALMLKIEYTFL